MPMPRVHVVGIVGEGHHQLGLRLRRHLGLSALLSAPSSSSHVRINVIGLSLLALLALALWLTP